MSPNVEMQSRSAKIRQELGYPVIDGDGHIIELSAVFRDYVNDHGHGALLTGMLFNAHRTVEELSMEERRQGMVMPNSWHHSADTDYYATVTSPRRYYERLGEAGIDFAVLYPTSGLSMLQLADDEQRVTLCRMYNEFMAEQYRPFRDRFTVPALVPMHTPAEAIAALEHAKGLGSKVGLIASKVHRAMPGETWPPQDEWADIRVPGWETGSWVDTFGIDSLYDYDPVWAKAIELQFPLAAHTSGIGETERASISNFVFNQIGHFAAAGGALAKSLFLGGVTTRFPELRMALLEGGAAVGVEVYIGLVSNWQKRGGDAIAALDPAHLDRDRIREMLIANDPSLDRYTADQLSGHQRGMMTRAHDDFAAAHLTSVEDIRDRFCTNFAWGCEADDPLVGLAFDTRVTPLGARIPALFASDLGHWDVPSFDDPLHEAYELVERGILDEDQLREFVFANPARFYGSLNPDFFTGTTVEAETSKLLKA